MGVTAPVVEEGDLTQVEMDAFFARNRDALNESLREVRANLAKGIRAKRTIKEIIADGKKRYAARA